VASQMMTTAVQAAEAAGQILLENYEAVTGIERKADGTFVTDVDKECSRLIGAALRDSFPNIVRGPCVC
jgi:fructose-1,6-bisphosphatase/inositol monophosphatase family enzyme